MKFIATFYSHFGAIRFKNEAHPSVTSIELMPVPRNLSSSCGTCARFEAPDDYTYSGDESGEVEQVVRETESGFEKITVRCKG